MHLVSARGSQNDRGFALLAVTIAVAALALMIAAVGEAAHRHVNEVRGSIGRLKMGAALDGAITTVAAGLADGNLSADVLASPQAISVGGISVSVSARPEGSKIDLNAAPPALLSDLFQAIGVESERAMKLADSIADWRDADSFAGANGAEMSEYLSAGRGYGPANHNFESVSELGLVLGADDGLVACLASDVTVFTNVPGVDARYASEHVRDALGAQEGAQGSPGLPIGGESIQPGVILEFMARATAEDGTVISREAIFRLTGNPQDPVWTLASIVPAPNPAEADIACKAFVAEGKDMHAQ